MAPSTRSRTMTRAAGVIGVTLIAAATAAALRPAATETGAFIVTIGRDTLAAETYVRTDSVLTGTSVLRSDRATLTRVYTLTLDKAGNLAKYEVTTSRAGGDATQRPLAHAIVTPMGDAFHEVIHTDSARTLHMVTPRATIPFMFIGFGMWETVVMRAVKGGQDSTAIPQLFVSDTTHYTTVVKRLGKDSVVITSVFGVARAKIDAQGHILGYTAPGSTTQVNVARIPSVDIKAFATAYAARPIGQLSPTDTVHAAVGAAKVTIVYSRPSARGRVIFGDVVPWNVWWRTGANFATSFVTDKDLVIGGTTVPAGAYTLFSLPNPTSWKLIVSKKTGEWGTEYDPTMDLARIDMKVATLAQPLEEMMITVTPAGELVVSWARTAASVAMQAK
jgi:hypothetical protein